MTEASQKINDGVSTGVVSFGGGHTAATGGAQGFLAHPEDGKPHPGVILIQEWWGIEPHIKDLAARLARAGYVVLAPDLYHGKVATEPNEAQKARMALDSQQAAGEILDGVEYLIGRGDVAPKRVGVVGFCMGGFLTWLIAEMGRDDVAAVAPFYGAGFQPTPSSIAGIKAPVLAVWGEQDQSIPAAARDQIVNLLRQEGKNVRALVYPAGHAFMNDQHASYDAQAASEAWSELLAWFKRYLG